MAQIDPTSELSQDKKVRVHLMLFESDVDAIKMLHGEVKLSKAIRLIIHQWVHEVQSKASESARPVKIEV